MTTPDILWKELEADNPGNAGSGILKRLIAPESACTMFLGVHRPSLNRLFMLVVAKTLLPSREQIPESRGFELNVQTTGEEPQNHATIVLSVTDRVYSDVFTAMIENICQHLVLCKDERQVVRVFLERLVQWQQFLEKNGSNGLSMESQIGLYGELYFLKTHLLSTTERYTDELSFWTGPKNRQHDFQSGETAIEVKASTGKQHQKLMISSEQQLDETLVGNLFLFHLSLSLVENQVNTLPALVASLRQTLK